MGGIGSAHAQGEFCACAIENITRRTLFMAALG